MSSRKNGPDTSGRNKSVRIERVRVARGALVVGFDDGRSISVPLDWYPRLSSGSAKERGNYELIGDGDGIHWPDLDEDLSAEGLLAGRRSMERASSLRRWLEQRKMRPITPKS